MRSGGSCLENNSFVIGVLVGVRVRSTSGTSSTSVVDAIDLILTGGSGDVLDFSNLKKQAENMLKLICAGILSFKFLIIIHRNVSFTVNVFF